MGLLLLIALAIVQADDAAVEAKAQAAFIQWWNDKLQDPLTTKKELAVMRSPAPSLGAEAGPGVVTTDRWHMDRPVIG